MEGRRTLLVLTGWGQCEGNGSRERGWGLRRQRCEGWRRRVGVGGRGGSGGGNSCSGGGDCSWFGSQLAHTFFQGLVLLQRFNVAELQLCLVFQHPLLLVLPGVTLLVKVEGLALALLPLQA